MGSYASPDDAGEGFRAVRARTTEACGGVRRQSKAALSMQPLKMNWVRVESTYLMPVAKPIALHVRQKNVGPPEV
jgi:hypothetical protein